MKLFLTLLLIGVVAGCTHKGSTYKHNEEWIDQKTFKLRCQIDANGSWRSDVVGCITPNGLTVPINSTIQDGNHEWECYINAARQVSLKKAVGKRANCMDGHAYGDIWVDKAFQFQCIENGKTKFLGCIIDPQGNRILPGERRNVNNDLIECQSLANGTVAIYVYPKTADAPCKDEKTGKVFAAGTKWIDAVHFEKKCGPFGQIHVTGCKIDEFDTPIPVNSYRKLGKINFHCEGKDGQYKVYSKFDEAPKKTI